MKVRNLLLITHGVAALVGAGVAATFALSSWRHAVDGAAYRSDAAISAHYSAMVDVAQERGDTGEYERALQNYVKVLDSILARDPRSSLYTALALDQAVALTRLAQFERKRGDVAAATEHMNKAGTVCQASGSAYCTPENLREWAARPSGAAAPQEKVAR